MTCDDVSPHLDEMVDGTLLGALLTQVTAHVEGCAACAEELRALRRLVAFAKELPPPPPPDQWRAVSADLTSRTPPRRWRPPSARRAVGVGLLVAAAAAALALLPDVGGTQQPPSPAPVAALDDLERAAMELQATLLGDPTLDPEVRQELQQTLGVIDEAIDEVGLALQATPRDGHLNRTLTRLKRRRLAVLAHTEVQLTSMEIP